ncbi:hypothetical protein A9995_09490 [Erythrobacter sp. QSSC1-22B]|nr:hypothetical protein A9995_09490 [Erythrobacter sp. QSSC1-22B]
MLALSEAACGEVAGMHSSWRGIVRARTGSRRGTVRFATGRGVLIILICRGSALADLKDGLSVIGRSATCTAPPARSAPPAAVADSFARAAFTDIFSIPVSTGTLAQSVFTPKKPLYRFVYYPRDG